MKTITFELSSPVAYSSPSSGGEIEGRHIDLKEPTGKISHLCCLVSGLSVQAIKNFYDNNVTDDMQAEPSEKNDEPKEDDDVRYNADEAKAMMNIIYGGGGDVNKLIVSMREIFREVAFIGSEKQMTIPLLNRMSHKDLELMVGAYLANFLVG